MLPCNTGTGASRRCDVQGELAWRAVSYTPYPIEEGAEGDRLRVQVGPVGERQLRTFVFERKLRQPSALLTVTLLRPMGVLFREERNRKRAAIDELAEGSKAAQKARVASYDRARRLEAPLPGDVLRGCTATTIAWPTKSLVFGAAPPQRYIVLYGADDQEWVSVAAALKSGRVADGPVTLVLERQLPQDK
jgi:hypothetical protein